MNMTTAGWVEVPITQTPNIVVIIVLVLVLCGMLSLAGIVVYRCPLQSESQSSRRVPQQQTDEENTLPMDAGAIEERYRHIEEWLISKDVVEHGSHCSNNYVGQDDDSSFVPECQICMEQLSVGERVSWSMHCDHVYHLHCIREWLLKKSDCPFCRRPMLPLDAECKEMLKLELKKREKQERSYYCRQRGLQRSHCETDNSCMPPRQVTVDDAERDMDAQELSEETNKTARRGRLSSASSTDVDEDSDSDCS